MLSKRIIFILLLLFIVISLISGCSKEEKNSEESKTPVNVSRISVIELEEKNPPDLVQSEWAAIDEREYVERSVLIFKGKVMDKTEYVIEQKVSYKYTQKYYKTVYQFEISDIYYSDEELKVGDTVEIMSPVTSHSWDLEAISMEKGQEFILFAGLVRDMETSSGKVELTDLAKYFIGNPWKPIIVVDKNSYKIDPLFESMTNNSTIEKRKISDNYSLDVLVRQDENFISDLLELINKYKNK